MDPERPSPLNAETIEPITLIGSVIVCLHSSISSFACRPRRARLFSVKGSGGGSWCGPSRLYRTQREADPMRRPQRGAARRELTRRRHRANPKRRADPGELISAMCGDWLRNKMDQGRTEKARIHCTGLGAGHRPGPFLR